MNAMTLKRKRHKELIAYIAQHNRCTQADAEAWADNNLGNWRQRRAQRVKKVTVQDSNEKEWDDE
ncbi:phage protein [Shewanella carassii]|nr:phage protein [Shewanella carassii]